MKKIFALILALALVLSMSAVSYAAPSPKKTITFEDFVRTRDIATTPADYTAIPPATDHTAGSGVISLDEMNAQQKAEANKALSAVQKEGYLPVDIFYVDADGDAVVNIKLDENNIALVVYEDGHMDKFAPEDLVMQDDGTFEISVSGPCFIITAVEA